MSEIFISYARSTAVQAGQVAEALRALGYDVWRDDELPAHRAYTDVIAERLKAAKAVVVVWSAEATKSEWVQSEADHARLDRKLVQLTLDGVTPPMPFDRIQCADLVGWSGGADSPGWRKVVDSVSDLIGRPPSVPSPPRTPDLPAIPRRTGWRRWLGAPTAWVILAAVVLVSGLVVARLVSSPTPSSTLATPIVDVRAMDVIGNDPSLRPFAGRLSDAIAGFLGDSDVRIVSGPAADGGAGAPLAFGGAVSTADGQLHVRLTLVDKRSGTSLWSRDYAEPLDRADALIDEVKGGAMAIINTNRPSFGPSGLLLDPETMLLGMRGGEEASMETPGQINDALHQYELALARRPDSGILHAAYASALSVAGAQAPPSERAELFQRARAEAELTIRDHHPQSGLAYHALLFAAFIEAPRDYLGAEALLDKTLKAAPETDWLMQVTCNFHVTVGRARDGLTYCQRALALSPHEPQFTLDYATALDEDGDQPQLADQLLDEGARLYPGFVGIRAYRFMREAYTGSPDKALALLHDPATAPPFTPDEVKALEQLQKARKSGAPADADAAIALMRQAEAHLPSSDLRVFFPLALGRLDEAFAQQNQLGVDTDSFPPLMAGFTERLRRDARFWPLAAKAGLVRYWLTTDKWPDFCSDPTYPLDCRALAKGAAAGRPAS